MKAYQCCIYYAAYPITMLLLGHPSLAQAVQTTPPVKASAVIPAGVGHLTISIVIVSDLQPTPVLLTDFTITSGQVTQTVRTDSSGNIDLDLAPGHYHIESAKATLFKGQSYAWVKDFDIAADTTTKLSWTDSDAIVTNAPTPESHIADEAVIYKQVKSGVVTVEGDFGQGSGFVVDSSGLILTNQHVINGGRWAAVRFDHGIRVPAVIVAQDSAADVAVLAINPAAYSSYAVLKLADPSLGPLAEEGERVLAIGSPLGQEKVLTIGIVSKVEKEYLVSDVNINHGSSGGPLLNLDGKVIGITTFLDSAQNGPGISGIISIDKALPVLAEARQEISSITLPTPEMLPDISQTPIPEDTLDAATTKASKPYIDEGPKNFQTILITPFYLSALQAEAAANMSAEKRRRVNKRDANGIHDEEEQTPDHFWEQYALHDADPFVAVIIRPELQVKGSSKWADMAAALSTMGGVYVAAPPNKMEYRDDFWDMALYRDDTLVYPVRRERTNVQALEYDSAVSVKDTATGGIYFYDPSVFMPGATLRIYSRRESKLDRWDVRTIPAGEQQKIWDMFASYRATLDPSMQGAVVGLR